MPKKVRLRFPRGANRCGAENRNVPPAKICSEIEMGKLFVDTQWLARHLQDEDMRIVEVHFTRCFSSHEKVAEECREQYRSGHIPGAVYIDCISDLTDTSYKDIFYVATPDQFSKVMGRVGITNETMIVCYDEAPYPLAAARFWWTLRYYGHSRIRILAGGIRKWVKEGRALSKAIPRVSQTDYHPQTQPALRATKATIKKSLQDESTIIIDCLTYRQHHGKSRNSWSTRLGRIPGAVWLPPMELVNGLDSASPRAERDQAMANDEPYDFFPVEKLRNIFSQIGVKPGKRVITYCGKAEAACSVFLALKMAGIEDAAVYDGSLAEWSRDLSLPMVISPKKDN
jgi:thiosulfate/3-mercaptopyruvate sulfurtransferase